jgi:hypothetical protein
VFLLSVWLEIGEAADTFVEAPGKLMRAEIDATRKSWFRRVAESCPSNGPVCRADATFGLLIGAADRGC